MAPVQFTRKAIFLHYLSLGLLTTLCFVGLQILELSDCAFVRTLLKFSCAKCMGKLNSRHLFSYFFPLTHRS